jgi:hypothetical protein
MVRAASARSVATPGRLQQQAFEFDAGDTTQRGGRCARELRPLERRTQADDPQPAAQARTTLANDRPDLALEEGPRHGPTRVAFRDDGTEPDCSRRDRITEVIHRFDLLWGIAC